MSIFKAYDVRGIYSKDFSEKEAFLLGYYLVKQLDLTEFVVAHDLRLSHEQLTKFFLKGLLYAGCKPLYLGALSTPNFYYSLSQDISSGVIITASHNGPQYNGFKFMHNFKSYDSRNGLNELGILVEEDLDHIGVIFNEQKHEILSLSLEEFISRFSIEYRDYKNSYKNYLLKFSSSLFDKREIDILKSRRFAYNFSSGMSSQIMLPLLRDLGFDAMFFLEIPDGNFPNYDPNPTNAQEYLYNHIEGVEGTFCYDGDGDRIMFFDEEQRLVSEDYLIGMLLEYFKDVSSSFVVDLRASKYLFELSNKYNFSLEKMRVGRAFYQDYMEKHDCVFGGELSGHLFFREFFYLDNPDIATLYLLKIFARKFLHDSTFRTSLGFSKYIKYFKLREINVSVSDPKESIFFLKDKYSSFLTSELDGVSFEMDDVWFNVRASNTEPVLRITIEGESEQLCKIYLEKLLAYLK